MAQKPDSDRPASPVPELKTGPGGMTMRELHERVKNSAARDFQSAKAANKLAHKANRWQRLVRYVWDKKRGRS